MAAPVPAFLPFLIAIPLIGWRLYRRVRSSIGRQKYSKVRPWITLTVFPLLSALIVVATFAVPWSLGAFIGGAAVGVGLGYYGLSKTKFENTPEGMFYTPNAHLGIALSLVFTARVVYRMFELYSMDSAHQQMPDITRSPLTLAIFGLLAGYYVMYASGLIRWHRRVQAEAKPVAAV